MMYGLETGALMKRQEGKLKIKIFIGRDEDEMLLLCEYAEIPKQNALVNKEM